MSNKKYILNGKEVKIPSILEHQKEVNKKREGKKNETKSGN